MPDRAHELAQRHVDDGLAEHLADLVRRRLGHLAAHLGVVVSGDEVDLVDTIARAVPRTRTPATAGDILALDEALAGFLESSSGARGVLLAGKVRDKARDRWAQGADIFALWGADVRFARLVAEAVYHDEVVPLRARPAGFGRLVYQRAVRLTIERTEDLIIPRGLVDDLTEDNIARGARGAEHTRTPAWSRLLHHNIVRASLRKSYGVREPGRIWQGPLSGFAREVGWPQSEEAELRNALEYGQAARFTLGAGYSPCQLWGMWFRGPAPGRPAHLDLQVMPWLYDLVPPDGRRWRADRWCVFFSERGAPMVPGSSPNTHAQQWALWWAFHAWLPSRRDELAERGTLSLTPHTLERVAEDAGWSRHLRANLISDVLSAYLAARPDGLLLRTAEPGVFEPAPNLAPVVDALVRQQARAERRTDQARAGVRRREALDRKQGGR